VQSKRFRVVQCSLVQVSPTEEVGAGGSITMRTLAVWAGFPD